MTWARFELAIFAVWRRRINHSPTTPFMMKDFKVQETIVYGLGLYHFVFTRQKLVDRLHIARQKLVDRLHKLPKKWYKSPNFFILLANCLDFGFSCCRLSRFWFLLLLLVFNWVPLVVFAAFLKVNILLYSLYFGSCFIVVNPGAKYSLNYLHFLKLIMNSYS